MNNIKSIFGGIKNYFSKAPGATSKPSPSPSTEDFKSTTKLPNTVTNLQTDVAHVQSKGGASGSSLPESSKQALAGTRWGAMDDEIDENLGKAYFRFSGAISGP